MKSLKLLSLALFAVITFSISSCTPDDTEPKFTVTEINFSVSGNVTDSELNAKVHVTNTSDETITLHWIRQNVITPTGWKTTVCDHNQCYPETTNEQDLVLTAGEEIELKFAFYPEGIEGTGTADLVIYDKADRTNTEGTFNFSGTARL